MIWLGPGRPIPRSSGVRGVDLYETTPGATVRSIAEDLGPARGALRQWLALHARGAQDWCRVGRLLPAL